MKILHIISGLNRSSGGPSRSSQGLVAAECRAGVGAWIYSFDGVEPWIDGVRRFRPSDAELSVEDLSRFDLVHIHGIWSPKLHQVAVMCRAVKVPYIIAPRGMLDPWALSVKPFKKKLALWLYQKCDLKKAMAFHVTAEAEADHVKAQGLTQQCIISPNGVELPVVMPKKVEEKEQSPRKALFLSRLHPGKGLLSLVDAWAKVRPHGWIMEVVGPDTYGHKADVVMRLQSHGILCQWRFIDMLDDNEKWTAYRSADLLVHPSVSENFGITIAEGLAAELPVIATKGTPWSELESMRCGWWIDQGVDALSAALQKAIALSDGERAEMGARGKKLVEEKYTWDAVCEAMIKGYREVLNART